MNIYKLYLNFDSNKKRIYTYIDCRGHTRKMLIKN